MGNRWFGLWVTNGLSVGNRGTTRYKWARTVLELHELGYQAIFLIKLSMSWCHGGLKKYGTRAHQARVPQKVVDRYIVPKQCFWAKNFNN